jgi:hypothetical protein
MWHALKLLAEEIEKIEKTIKLKNFKKREVNIMQKDTFGTGDQMSFRVIRGGKIVNKGEVKPQNQQLQQNLEVELKKRNLLPANESLAQYQIKVWQQVMESTGRLLLNVSQNKFTFKVQLELDIFDPICQKCLCHDSNEKKLVVQKYCILNKKQNFNQQYPFICDSFIPTKEGIASLWKWILQGRILVWQT